MTPLPLRYDDTVKPLIGSDLRTLRPQFIRRSTNLGYQSGVLTAYGTTPREMERLSDWARAEPEAQAWFRYTLAIGFGFVLALIVLGVR